MAIKWKGNKQIDQLEPWNWGYPLVNIQKAIENGDLVRGFTH